MIHYAAESTGTILWKSQIPLEQGFHMIMLITWRTFIILFWSSLHSPRKGPLPADQEKLNPGVSHDFQKEKRFSILDTHARSSQAKERQISIGIYFRTEHRIPQSVNKMSKSRMSTGQWGGTLSSQASRCSRSPM
ncbi:hypothetical protein PMIN06_004078 [Paraphaeosphaeria minitans]